MKRTIKLTESELRQMISESVKKVLNEGIAEGKYGYTIKEIMSGNCPGYRYIKSPYGLMAIQPFSKYGSWLIIDGEEASIPLPEKYKNADDETIVKYAIEYLKSHKKELKTLEDDEDDLFWLGWD